MLIQDSEEIISLKIFPFVLPAFIEKSKKQYIGKKYVYTGKTIIDYGDRNIFDVNTGSAIDIVIGKQWTCVDLVLVDLEERFNSEYYIPVLVFRNSNGNEVYINFDSFLTEEYHGIFETQIYINRCLKMYNFQSLEDYELSEFQKKENEKLKQQIIERKKLENESQKQAIIQKYGDYYGKIINNKKVVIGMAMEMCLASWGQPFVKHENVTTNKKNERWDYGLYTNLFFEDGKLTIINQWIK